MENKTSRSRTWLTNNADGKWHDFLAITVWAESEGWPLMKVTLQDYITPIGVYHTGTPLPRNNCNAKFPTRGNRCVKWANPFFNTVTGIRSRVFGDSTHPYSRKFDALCARWISIFHTVELPEEGCCPGDKKKETNRHDPCHPRHSEDLESGEPTNGIPFSQGLSPGRGGKNTRSRTIFHPSLTRSHIFRPLDLFDLLPQINNDLTKLLSHWYLAAFVQKWTYHGRPDNELELQRAGPAMLLANRSRWPK